MGWLQRFMYGRYGQDNLNRFLSVSALVIYIVSIFSPLRPMSSLGLFLIIIAVFRMLSKNKMGRARENYAYLNIRGKVMGVFARIKTRFNQRKTHRFYKCPSCKTQLRVPKGKGLIRIRCTKCSTQFKKKT